MIKSCHESSDGTFRFELERVWGQGGRIVVFVMLNPSEANGEIDDPTLTRCIAFATAWGYDGLRIVNLIAYRSPKPVDMYAWLKVATVDELRHNRNTVLSAVQRSDVKLVVCAWGNLRPALEAYAKMLHRAIRNCRRTHAIKINGTGMPAHPLYLKGDLQPIEYGPTLGELLWNT